MSLKEKLLLNQNEFDWPIDTEDKFNDFKITKIIPLWRTECCSRQKKKKFSNFYIFLIPIINLSASRQNRFSENRDASKNRFFFPPLSFTQFYKHIFWSE